MCICYFVCIMWCACVEPLMVMITVTINEKIHMMLHIAAREFQVATWPFMDWQQAATFANAYACFCAHLNSYGRLKNRNNFKPTKEYKLLLSNQLQILQVTRSILHCAAESRIECYGYVSLLRLFSSHFFFSINVLLVVHVYSLLSCFISNENHFLRTYIHSAARSIVLPYKWIPVHERNNKYNHLFNQNKMWVVF